jgi:hypothetical protein
MDNDDTGEGDDMTTATTTRERPILFSAPMVKAILAGRKTQTRRIVKPQPPDGFTVGRCHYSGTGWALWEDPECRQPNGCLCRSVRCPYGGWPGDRLWVRETHKHIGNSSNGGPVVGRVLYRADDASEDRGEWPTFDDAPKQKRWNTGRAPWTPAIHMPRWASRITLEIVGVRVERLKDISNHDAKAEGVEPDIVDSGGVTPWGEGINDVDYVSPFYELWRGINGDASCAAKPWVWVVEFRRLDP